MPLSANAAVHDYASGLGHKNIGSWTDAAGQTGRAVEPGVQTCDSDRSHNQSPTIHREARPPAVSKRRDAHYQHDRSRVWLKIKN
jgi:hypothetical protein